MVLLAFTLFVPVGCDRAPGPGIAEVKVVNTEGLAQPGVWVKLFCTEPNCVVKREGRTNELGIYTTEFDLPVVLRIRAVKYDTTYTTEGLPPNQIKKMKVDSSWGEGYIQVENDMIAQETITLLHGKI
ncbi:MAG: hypothetical protein Kow0075_14880 [Salibacteraceae bacterium]